MTQRRSRVGAGFTDRIGGIIVTVIVEAGLVCGMCGVGGYSILRRVQEGIEKPLMVA